MVAGPRVGGRVGDQVDALGSERRGAQARVGGGLPDLAQAATGDEPDPVGVDDADGGHRRAAHGSGDLGDQVQGTAGRRVQNAMPADGLEPGRIGQERTTMIAGGRHGVSFRWSARLPSREAANDGTNGCTTTSSSVMIGASAAHPYG